MMRSRDVFRIVTYARDDCVTLFPFSTIIRSCGFRLLVSAIIMFLIELTVMNVGNVNDPDSA